jgi:Tfp pilus assembly protein PilF
LFFNDTWALQRVAAAFFAGSLACTALAAPYRPKDDAAVLERLPVRPADPITVELRRLRADLVAAPGDPAAAAALAQRYFELASAEGDPRYIGYAEAALRNWRGKDAPVEVLFSRGLLRQYRHDFAGALADFEHALQRDPSHASARAWRAAIFMVQADYASAARECGALADRASALAATGCSAFVEATTGNTAGAYQRLAESLSREPDAPGTLRLWTLTRLAEMAWRLGQTATAEGHFRDALALRITDNFLLAAYADFLLEQGRAAEVVGLLKEQQRSDTLLLRLAIAERHLKRPAARQHEQALADRFAAAALRGERLHLAEEARFLLDLKQQPRAALAAAAENWKAQREPRDAKILLEAAVAASDPQAAAPALRWLEETRFESEQLRRLAGQLKK